MNGCIKNIHPRANVTKRADQCETDIDHGNSAGNFGRARKDFSKCIKTFGPEDLHTTHTQLRQEHHRHNNDTNPTKPLQDCTPQQQPFGQVFKTRKHSGASCCEAGHRFEKCIDKTCVRFAHHKRNGPKNRQCDPNPGGQQKCLLDRQTLAHAVGTAEGDESACQACY